MFMKMGDSLWCQVDFWYYYQCLFVLSEYVFQYVEINFCFIGIGNVCQQLGRKSICCVMNCVNGGGLFGI